ncbi:MAG TPA: hypothetical protein VFV86_08045 [Nitrososphaeraceae archaeon]|nr:hypothetical protein [Nitrososphaeraceae archaeon]
MQILKHCLEISFQRSIFTTTVSDIIKRIKYKHKKRIIKIQKLRYAKLMKGLTSFNFEDAVANIVCAVGIRIFSSDLVPCITEAIGIGIVLPLIEKYVIRE